MDLGIESSGGWVSVEASICLVGQRNTVTSVVVVEGAVGAVVAVVYQ